MLSTRIVAVVCMLTGAQAWNYQVPAGLKNTARPAPLPQNDTSVKLVNDKLHPFIKPGPTDLRGPCPGLNTLANHGYLPRNGIVTPQQIVIAVQDGFNLGNDVARLLAFGAFMVDGNPFTNLMSLGPKDPRVGKGPVTPPNNDYGAPNAGLNTHSVFEGDASTTRGDFEFGDNFSFNETLFDQLKTAANNYGGGYYNPKSAAEVRYNRIQDSKARNPNFQFVSPRFSTAYAESAFPYLVWVDGRYPAKNLDLVTARSFFQTNKFPEGFNRRKGALHFLEFGSEALGLFLAHPTKAGNNKGAGNFTEAPDDPGFSSLQALCYIGINAADRIPTELYPNTTGVLREIMNANWKSFYDVFENFPFAICPKRRPFGEYPANAPKYTGPGN